jgi:dihydrodipicolinate synthase/N-acetylneuraminate lyase
MESEKRGRYGGVIVPMVSPLTNVGDADEAGVSRLIEHFVAHKVKPFVLGTTGEAPSLSVKVRHDLVKYAADCLKNRTVLFAGISNTCLRDSLADAESFAKSGAHVLVATPPAYYPLSEMALQSYFENLAEALPLPLVLYNMPATTHISIPLAIVERLSQHPNIVGLKDSERDEERIRKASKIWRDRSDFVFLTGWAASSVWALEDGAAGIVPSTGNLVPGWYHELLEAASGNDFERARELQTQTDALSLLYQKNRNLSESLVALKVLLHIKGLCGAEVSAPLVRMNQQEEAVYSAQMKKELIKMKVL